MSRLCMEPCLFIQEWISASDSLPAVWRRTRLPVASWFVPSGGWPTPPESVAGLDCDEEGGAWLQWCHPGVFGPAPSSLVQRATMTSLQMNGWVGILMERFLLCQAALKQRWEDVMYKYMIGSVKESRGTENYTEWTKCFVLKVFF